MPNDVIDSARYGRQDNLASVESVVGCFKDNHMRAKLDINTLNSVPWTSTRSVADNKDNYCYSVSCLKAEVMRTCRMYERQSVHADSDQTNNL